MAIPLPFGAPDRQRMQPYFGEDISGGAFTAPNPFAGTSSDFDSALSQYGTAVGQAEAVGQPVDRPGGLLTGIAGGLDRFVSAGSGFATGLLGADLVREDGTVDVSEGGLMEAIRRAGEGAGGQHIGWGDWEPLRFDEDDSGLERFAKGAAAFTGDVLSDPLTYISFGTSIGRGAASRVAAGQLSKEAGEELLEAAGRRTLGDAAEGATRRQVIEEGKRSLVSELDNRTVLGSVLDTNRYDMDGVVRATGTDDVFNVETRKLVDLLDESELDDIIRSTDKSGAISPRTKDVPESALPGSTGQSLVDLAVNTIGEGAYRIGGARRLRSEMNRLFGDYGDEVFKRMHPDVTGGARLRVPFLRENPATGERGFGFLGDRPRASIPLYPGQTGGGQVIDSPVGRMLGLQKGADTIEGIRKWVSSRDLSQKIARGLGGRWGGLAAEIMADVARAAADEAESPGQFTRLVTHRLAAEGRERFRMQATEAYENLIRNAPQEWRDNKQVHAQINNYLANPDAIPSGDEADDVARWSRELREFYDRWGTQLEELGLIPPVEKGRRANYIPHLVKDEYLDRIREYRLSRSTPPRGVNVGSGHGNLKQRQMDDFWEENSDWLAANGLDVFELEDPELFNQMIEEFTGGQIRDVFVEDPFEVFNEYQRRMLSMVSEYHYAALMERLGLVTRGDALNQILRREGGARFWPGAGPDPDEGVPPDVPRVPMDEGELPPVMAREAPGPPQLGRGPIPRGRGPVTELPAPSGNLPEAMPPWSRTTPPGYEPGPAGLLGEPTTPGVPDGTNVNVTRAVGPDMEPSPRLGTLPNVSLDDKLAALKRRVTVGPGDESQLGPAELAALQQARQLLDILGEAGSEIEAAAGIRGGVPLEQAQEAVDVALRELDEAMPVRGGAAPMPVDEGASAADRIAAEFGIREDRFKARINKHLSDDELTEGSVRTTARFFDIDEGALRETLERARGAEAPVEDVPVVERLIGDVPGAPPEGQSLQEMAEALAAETSEPVTLYRGVGPEGADPQELSEFSGRWFTPDRDVALDYAGGDPTRLRTVTVEMDELAGEGYRHIEPQMTAGGFNDVDAYVVPEDVAARATFEDGAPADDVVSAAARPPAEEPRPTRTPKDRVDELADKSDWPRTRLGSVQQDLLWSLPAMSTKVARYGDAFPTPHAELPDTDPTRWKIAVGIMDEAEVDELLADVSEGYTTSQVQSAKNGWRRLRAVIEQRAPELLEEPSAAAVRPAPEPPKRTKIEPGGFPKPTFEEVRDNIAKSEPMPGGGSGTFDYVEMKDLGIPHGDLPDPYPGRPDPWNDPEGYRAWIDEHFIPVEDFDLQGVRAAQDTVSMAGTERYVGELRAGTFSGGSTAEDVAEGAQGMLPLIRWNPQTRQHVIDDGTHRVAAAVSEGYRSMPALIDKRSPLVRGQRVTRLAEAGAGGTVTPQRGGVPEFLFERSGAAETAARRFRDAVAEGDDVAQVGAERDLRAWVYNADEEAELEQWMGSLYADAADDVADVVEPDLPAPLSETFEPANRVGRRLESPDTDLVVERLDDGRYWHVTHPERGTVYQTKDTTPESALRWVDENAVDDLLDMTPEPKPKPEPAAQTMDVGLVRPEGAAQNQTFTDGDIVDFEVEGGPEVASPARWRERRLSASQMWRPRSHRKDVSRRVKQMYDRPIEHPGGGAAPEGRYYSNQTSMVRVPDPSEVEGAAQTRRLKSWQKHLDKRAEQNVNDSVDTLDPGKLVPEPDQWGPVVQPQMMRSRNGQLTVVMESPDGATKVSLDGEDWRVVEEVVETLSGDDLEDALSRTRVYANSGRANLSVVTYDEEVIAVLMPAQPPRIEGGSGDMTPDIVGKTMAQEGLSLVEHVENTVRRQIDELLAPLKPRTEPGRTVSAGEPEFTGEVTLEDFLARQRARERGEMLPEWPGRLAPFRKYGTEGDMLPEAPRRPDAPQGGDIPPPAGPPPPPDGPLGMPPERIDVFGGRELELAAYIDIMEALRATLPPQVVDEGADMAATMSTSAQRRGRVQRDAIDEAILAFDDMPHKPQSFTAPDYSAPAEVRSASRPGHRNRLEMLAKAAGLDYQNAIQGKGRKAQAAPPVRDSKVWHGLLMDDFTRDALKRFGREGKWEEFATATFEPYMRWFRTQATVGRGPGFVIRNVIGGLANARLVGATTGDMLDGMAIARMWARADKQVTSSVGDTSRLFGVALNEARHDAFEKLVRARWDGEVADQIMEAHDLFIANGLADIRQMSLAELADFTGRSRLFDQKDADELNVVEQVLEKTALGIGPTKKVTEVTSNWTKEAEHALRFGAFMAGMRRYGLEDGGYAAAQLTKASQFDYGDLSSFERNVMRQVIPFYTFTRNNLPLNVRGLLTDPAKFAHLQRGMEYLEEGFAPEEGSEGDAYSQVLPEWLEENLGFVTGIPLGGGVAALRAESPKVHLEQWLPNPTRLGERPRQQIDTMVSQANPLFDVIFGGLTNKDPFTGQEIGTGDSSSGKVDWFARQASPLYANLRRLTPGQGTDRDKSRRAGAWLSTFAGVPAVTIDEDAAQGALRARSRELIEQSNEQLDALSEQLGIETTELKRLIREYGADGAAAVLGVDSGTLQAQP